MSRWEFRLFGLFPLLVVTRTELQYVEDEEESPAVGGGSCHNFTIASPWVDERYLPWEDEGRVFGFGAR